MEFADPLTFHLPSFAFHYPNRNKPAAFFGAHFKLYPMSAHHIRTKESLISKTGVLRSLHFKVHGKRLKAAIKIALGLMLVGTAVFYFLPVKEDTINYNYPLADTTGEFDNIIGWYQSNTGNTYHLTWSANKDILLNRYDSIRASNETFRFSRIDQHSFDMDGDSLTSELTINTQKAQAHTTLSLRSGKTNLELTKLDTGPYNTREVAFYNDSIKLAGSLLVPNDSSHGIGIVMIHGSGDSDRDSFWYQYQAHYLASQGFHVLLPDKRGCGKSMGTWHDASFSDFAEDALAAVNYMKADSSAVLNKIGLMGISQGSWIGHLASSKSDEVDLIVDVVGSVQTPRKQLSYELRKDIGMGFFSSVIVPFVSRKVRKRRPVWWEKNGGFDPMPLITGSSTPILKISAEKDKNVNTRKCVRYIEKLHNTQPELPLDMKVLSGSGHTLFDEETEWISHEYLAYVSAWLKKNR